MAEDKRKQRHSFHKAREEPGRTSMSEHGIVILCGELHKQASSGMIKRWIPRYFEASGHYLKYYDSSATKDDVKGFVDMTDAVKVKVKGDKVKIDLGDSTIKLRAKDESEASAWGDCLTSQMGSDVAEPVHASIDTDSVWVSVSIQAATDLVAKDIGGSSDPYVKVMSSVPKVKKSVQLGKTATHKKNLNPTFEEEIGYFCNKNATLTIQVFDFDAVGDHDFMGQVSVDLTDSEALSEFKALEWIPLQGKKKGSKVAGKIQLAVNVYDPDAEPASMGYTVDRDLPKCMHDCMHRTAFHANANVNRGSHYPYNKIVQHIQRGSQKTKAVLAHQDRFKNKQDVCDFAWLCFYKAAEKNVAFVSGAWMIEDPNYTIFANICRLSYSRKFGASYSEGQHPGYAKTNFGSTHFIEYVAHCAKRGAWQMPHDNSVYELEKGGKGLGYFQTGIDVDIDSLHNDGTVDMGLFCDKAHLVAGKVPHVQDGDNFMFFKAEHFGTQHPADQVNHTNQLIKSKTGGGHSGPHRGPKRVEKVDKAKLKPFNSILEMALGLTSMQLFQTELTQGAIEERAKCQGLCYMMDIVERIQAGTNASQVRAACL